MSYFLYLLQMSELYNKHIRLDVGDESEQNIVVTLCVNLVLKTNFHIIFQLVYGLNDWENYCQAYDFTTLTFITIYSY